MSRDREFQRRQRHRHCYTEHSILFSKKKKREREYNRSVVVRKEIPHSLRNLKKIPILTFVNHYVI